MNLLFDIWIKYPGYKNYTPEEEQVLKTIWDYVYDRIYLLIPDIENEEINTKTPEKPPAVIIYLMNKPTAVQPRGYSDALCDKIIKCFNENDGRILGKMIVGKLQSLLN